VSRSGFQNVLVCCLHVVGLGDGGPRYRIARSQRQEGRNVMFAVRIVRGSESQRRGLIDSLNNRSSFDDQGAIVIFVTIPSP